MAEFTCSICLNGMHTSVFLDSRASNAVAGEAVSSAEAEDHLDADDPTCARLSCGHAFHANCILKSLRLHGPSCPSCRNEPENPRLEELRQAVEEQQDLDTTADLIFARMYRMPSVKALRTRHNQLRENFRDKCQALSKERKEVVRKALAEFRDKHRKNFTELLMQCKESYCMILAKEQDLLIRAINVRRQQSQTEGEIAAQEEHAAEAQSARDFALTNSLLLKRYASFWDETRLQSEEHMASRKFWFG